MRLLLPILAACSLCTIASLPVPALACASCACGDPTLVVMGTEQPFAGRLRLSAELRTRSERMGNGDDRHELHERRLDLGAAWSPSSWLTLSLTLPLVDRELGMANLARVGAQAVGDVEVRARVYVWRTGGFGREHLLALHGGVELPTSPTIRRGGVALADEVQPGTSSLDLLAGASWLHLRGSFSFYASAVALLPRRTPLGYTPGRALLGTAAAQVQPWDFLALRGGLDGRWERAAIERDGTVRPDTGGFALFASPAILFQPWTDWLLQLQLRIPAWQRMRGEHEEGTGLGVGVIRDL